MQRFFNSPSKQQHCDVYRVLLLCVWVSECVCDHQSDSLPTQQHKGVTEGLPLR